MHADQLSFTADDVAHLVQEHFPQFADLPVRPVPSAGTVNALFRLGEDLVARLRLQPSDDAAEQVHQEVQAARRLLTVSPVPTPVPVAVGQARSSTAKVAGAISPAMIVRSPNRWRAADI